MKNDELDAATVERCAQVADAVQSRMRDECDFGAGIAAKEIRSLIPNSAGAPGTSHRGPSAGESDPTARQDCALAGTVPAPDRLSDKDREIVEKAQAWGYPCDELIAIIDRLSRQPEAGNECACGKFDDGNVCPAPDGTPLCVNTGQPEAEPVAWIEFADNGNIRFWTSDPARAWTEGDNGRPLRKFTLAELVALAASAGRDSKKMARLLTTAKLLLQNAIGCAAIGLDGQDFEQHGKPGWLMDAEKDIAAADAIIRETR